MASASKVLLTVQSPPGIAEEKTSTAATRSPQEAARHQAQQSNITSSFNQFVKEFIEKYNLSRGDKHHSSAF